MKIGPVLQHLRSDGLRGFGYDVRALLELVGDRHRLASTRRTASGVRTSISDDEVFPRFCELASDDDAVFARFRRSAMFMNVLEHVDREQGAAYLREIQLDPIVLDRLRSVLVAKDIGDPRTYRFDEVGLVSPTTLRYGKVAADLHKLFGDLSDKKVAEVGVGYGGQARVIATVWQPKRYELYDLPATLNLARRFLTVAGLDLSLFAFRDGRTPEPTDAELVVSNYAISEVRREVQDLYLQNFVRTAPRGYLTYNHITPPEFKTYTATEIVAMIPGARILPEVPLTHRDNVIIVWGDHPN